jgi:DNA topoisomerase-1
MSNSLVIVESPAKGKTIEKYLGKGFQVLASYGHVRDLVPKEGAVDPDNGFAMQYEVSDRHEKYVKKIAQALKKADTLYLATDPDREGEAISWHLSELLKERGDLQDKQVHRVVFHEITKTAVNHAVANPRGLAYPLINAQQARRALDFLVGFKLSPLLWRKIKPSLSAGRVQSPALRMIVEREADIERFEPQEYWRLTAHVDKTIEDKPHAFTARLHTFAGKKLEQFDINTEDLANNARDKLLADAQGLLIVTRVEKKQRKRHPAPPFTTSTLQQEAARKLRFSARRTMQVAQQLYEGIDLGSGSVGLITYMRTDSVTLANEAIADIRDLIVQQYSHDYLPASPRAFKNKAKNAQEAHEAIRPTSVFNIPDKIRSQLTDDQYRLYDLIWKRTIACQMIHAVMDTVSVDLSASEGNFFRANGSSIRHAGFLLVYREGLDDNAKDDTKEAILPPLNEGDKLNLQRIETSQHFTEPPPRFSEASLVKALEEYGIGRPSTYASIISTLQTREYVELESRRFIPTDIGKIVGKFLTDHFTQYVDYDFTAKLEDDLDEISRGEKDWLPVLDEFWQPFQTLVLEKDKTVSREEVMQARELGTDPKTGKPISVRMGRYGPFVQIGTKDDEEKPQFASLRLGQKMDEITLDDAFELFKLPRHLGETPQGEKITTNFGRFGPYVKYGSKYVSLKEDDPYSINLERALVLIQEKQAYEASRVIQNFAEENIQVLKGRREGWRPYVTNGDKNVTIPKGKDPLSLSLADCQTMLANAPDKKSKKKTITKKTTKAAEKTTEDETATSTKTKTATTKAKRGRKKASGGTDTDNQVSNTTHTTAKKTTRHTTTRKTSTAKKTSKTNTASKAKTTRTTRQKKSTTTSTASNSVNDDGQVS